MTIQRQLPNGTWIDEDKQERIDMFLDSVLEREPWFAPRVNREPMTTREQVLAYLSSGKQINHDSEWYSKLRIKPQPRPARLADYEYGRKLDCGCTVYFSGDVLTSSRGTSCPNCYDRMSN